MNDRISITMLEDGIADVRMTRVDKMNALDGAQWNALVEAIDQLQATPGLRVVVLSGEGGSDEEVEGGGIGLIPGVLGKQNG